MLSVSLCQRKPSDKDLTDFYRSGGNILDLIAFEVARDKWEREPNHHSKVAQAARSADQALADLRIRRDGILAKWNQLFDQLEGPDQHISEFDTLFAEWEQVNEEYTRLDDPCYQRLEERLQMKEDNAPGAEDARR